jgi:hypothetical protein
MAGSKGMSLWTSCLSDDLESMAAAGKLR